MASLKNKGITTIVGFHDLLGYGQMLAASSGTLDSAVGEIAYQRILGLQRSVAEVRGAFPTGTRYFHFNDTLTAYLDVDIDITWRHTDSTGIGMLGGLQRTECLKVLHFVSGCATLHQRSIAREEQEGIGPAGRTFVILGKRWALDPASSADLFYVPPLQANLAFAEAYLADAAGTRAGFSHRSYSRLYLNDYVWMMLQFAVPLTSRAEIARALGGERAATFPEDPLTEKEQNDLHQVGASKVRFPQSILTPDADPIFVDIFHRRRKFYSVMSHHSWDIARALKLI